MRHLHQGRILGRSSTHRHAMLRNMVSALLKHERIQTTRSKAKEVRMLAERMITLGKKGDLNARRRALRIVHGKDVVQKLFNDLGPRFQARPGGYTRIVHAANRVGDNAPMSYIELIPAEKTETKSAAKPKAKKADKE